MTLTIKGKTINPKFVVAGLILTILLAASGYKLWSRGAAGITATGSVEITRADITSKVGGYIIELKAKEGDSVKAGQVVLKIDRLDLTAQLLRDEAALVKAQIQLRDLESGARSQELLDAAANLASAQSQATKARNDYERYSRLYKDGAISVQMLDTARSASEVASQALRSAEARYSLVVEGNRPDVIAAQRLEVERSKAIVDVSRSQVADMTVASPLTGRILTKNYEQGEYVNPGAPIFTVGDMSDCWVKIYVSSAQLGLIKVGQAASVKVDSFPDRVFAGEIREISQSAEFTPRQSITQRERTNLVFYVKVKVDNAADLLKPGMPADVTLQ